MNGPAAEEMQRVREWECSSLGHSWTPITQFPSPIPTIFSCGRCGTQLRVVPESEDLLRLCVCGHTAWAHGPGPCGVCECDHFDTDPVRRPVGEDQ